MPTSLLPGRYVIGTQTFAGGEPFAFDANINTGTGVSWVEGRFNFDNALMPPTTAHHDSGSYFGSNFKYTLGDNIEIFSLTTRQIVQRDDQNTVTLLIEGTVAGSSTCIEVRAMPVTGYSGTATSWTLIAETVGDDTFFGSLDVSAGWYVIEVRGMDGGAQVTSTSVNRVGVGDVFITAGQSNSANYGSPRQSAHDDRVSARTSASSNSWQHATDPQPIATGSGGSPWPQLGDLLVKNNGVPVGFISVGVGSTRADQWIPGTSNYDDRLKVAMTSLIDYGGFKAILWHQGESDSIAGTSSADYAVCLQQIIAQSRTDAGWHVPWGVALASYHPASSMANEAQVIAGQQSVIDGDALVFEGAFTDDFYTLG